MTKINKEACFVEPTSFKSYMIDGQVVKVQDAPEQLLVTKDDNTTEWVDAYIHTFPDGSLEMLPKPDDSKLIK